MGAYRITLKVKELINRASSGCRCYFFWQERTSGDRVPRIECWRLCASWVIYIIYAMQGRTPLPGCEVEVNVVHYQLAPATDLQLVLILLLAPNYDQFWVEQVHPSILKGYKIFPCLSDQIKYLRTMVCPSASPIHSILGDCYTGYCSNRVNQHWIGVRTALTLKSYRVFFINYYSLPEVLYLLW